MNPPIVGGSADQKVKAGFALSLYEAGEIGFPALRKMLIAAGLTPENAVANIAQLALIYVPKERHAELASNLAKAGHPEIERAPYMIGTLLVCASLLAVDGDTIKCDGVNLRDMGDGAPNVSGYDTPEISRPQCAYERDLGREATIRMEELLRTRGLQIIDSGKRDRYKRPLVSAMLADGRTIGAVLISEGLAVRWEPGYQASWCQ